MNQSVSMNSVIIPVLHQNVLDQNIINALIVKEIEFLLIKNVYVQKAILKLMKKIVHKKISLIKFSLSQYKEQTD